MIENWIPCFRPGSTTHSKCPENVAGWGGLPYACIRDSGISRCPLMCPFHLDPTPKFPALAQGLDGAAGPHQTTSITGHLTAEIHTAR